MQSVIAAALCRCARWSPPASSVLIAATISGSTVRIRSTGALVKITDLPETSPSGTRACTASSCVSISAAG
jgi:hypothetical protein